MSWPRFMLRGGPTTQWAAANPVLLARELGVDTTTGDIRVGNGTTPWSGLPSNLTTGKVSRGEQLVNVKDHGATGNGTTDDTAAITAAITAGAGRTVIFPPGTYLVDATANTGHMSHAVGLRLTAAGTRLQLDRAATIKVKPNSATRYSAVEVTAADCAIEGGTILGDVGTHTGGTGEWGYGIDINTGAHRCLVRGVRVTKCWGDGIVIGDGSSFSGATPPTDVRIIDVTCEDNRRNNISVIGAARPQIIGGSFVDAGLTAYTAPGAGIAIEPNPGGSQYVSDALVTGAIAKGNKGRGVYVHGQGNTCTVTVTGVRSTANLADGFAADSSTARVVFQGCTAEGNTLDGFLHPATAGPTEYVSCVSRVNSGNGFQVLGARASLNACTARDNVKAGFYVGATATTPKLNACNAIGNCTGGTFLREFEVFALDTMLNGCVAEVGTNTTKATIGFAVRAGATAGRMIGCAVRGTFATAAYQVQTDTVVNPPPGQPFGVNGVTTGTTAPAAGGAGALPATPLGYLTININGTDRKVAFYA